MSRCSVALVNPPFNGTFDGAPIGLLYLGAALENAGHDVTLHDFGGIQTDMAQAAAKVLDRRPGIIGIGGTSPSFAEALRLATEIRRRDKEVWIVKGGCHERFGRQVDAFCGLDGEAGPMDAAVFAAAAESQMVQLARDRADGMVNPRPMDGIRLRWTARVGLGLSSPLSPAVSAIRLAPVRHLISDRGRYTYGGIFGGANATQVITYRGCPFDCSFCALPKDVLWHEWEAVERDIRGLRVQGYDAVFIDDGTFTLDWDWAKRVCDLLHECGLMWACQTRVDKVNEERLTHMARSGCVYVYYGLESGSDRVRKAINKPLEPTEIVKGIQRTRELGMRATASFIFGVPLGNAGTEHDSREDWEASVKLIREAKPHNVIPTIFSYYPGSPAWDRLPERRKGAYVKGESREPVWSFFDDGYGGIHHVTKEVAGDIRDYLSREIPDYLWPGLAAVAKSTD